LPYGHGTIPSGAHECGSYVKNKRNPLFRNVGTAFRPVLHTANRPTIAPILAHRHLSNTAPVPSLDGEGIKGRGDHAEFRPIDFARSPHGSRIRSLPVMSAAGRLDAPRPDQALTARSGKTR